MMARRILGLPRVGHVIISAAGRYDQLPMATPESEFDAESFIRNLTVKPGVYRMLDGQGAVLYVGKARNLRKRVASYFRPGQQLSPKVRSLMAHMRSVEVAVTRTEGEALLLENNLIKEFKPRYNVVLRDDKSYPYIYLATDQDFPLLAFHRGARRGESRGPRRLSARTRRRRQQGHPGR